MDSGEIVMRKFVVATVAAVSLMGGARSVSAQQQDTAIARLRREVEALTREIEAMRLGEEVVARADTAEFGLGPAASKVYRARPGISIGGYGEILLQKAEEEEGAESTVDALRLIAYVGYKFTPKILFNSEIEFEHASTEYGGSVSVEFAYIDYVASPHLGVRGGMLLVPMGFINELHEPPVFLGAKRPLTETNIIPSTWRENGVGIFGESMGLAYRAYLINGFDAVGGRFEEAEGFSASGLRDGRQSGSEALIGSPAVAARLDYTLPGIPGLMVGGSAYFGNSVQGDLEVGGEDVRAPTSILEAHGRYTASGLDLRGLYAFAHVGDAAELNQVHGFTGEESIGEDMHGWYVQAGYDLLRRSSQQLIPFIRYEALDTQASVPRGFLAAPENDRTSMTLGAVWKPITNIAVKADYQINDNQADTGVNQLSVSLGYLF
jgi:hypothetical protein